ncbi:asparagine synthase (glutamine-hydrolyzing) [Chamaesiphon sp. VAR_48_metabat_135_sub]|uniref:asparagine synthase (glutamine-hydrolyzing) n=1 Tax=Chamaesiphon sp. VAR_48_metabat_135_sub TaxID=2964699 RepID=UPI00286BE54C|nr:asparagine synthase (glutamine-hydrolyzing) [Chamaesiphon sp. VAR_48_metabat_135_sub]
MCGIAGYWHRASKFSQEQSDGIITAMTDALVLRGPDSSGIWVDPNAGIALGHRRLAILDLSPEGAQPMLSRSGRYAIVFNGEIYNFGVLRAELNELGHEFRGHSDTEVMLAAITEWGVTAAVKRFIGMFAFALWDIQEQVLHLGRDRLGEKPLYYGWVGDTLLFGSELKALVAHPQWQGEIDRDALALFVRHGYIPAPHSIYQGIGKLPQGTIVSLPASQPQAAQPIPYWDLQAAVLDGISNPFQGSDAEGIAHLDQLLRETINEQMVADVPLGAFLSGGIDSSTVVALMQAQSTRPIKTFSIGFTEQKYNEAEYAKAVAAHLGTEHTELYVTPEDALEVIPQLPTLYDEPFADSSQIPTYLLSKLTRQHVTVSLSGDAGDELFCGYSRYFTAQKIWQKISWIPTGMRQFYAKLLLSVPMDRWDEIVNGIGKVVPRLQQPHQGFRVHLLANFLNSKQPLDLYSQMMSSWENPEAIVLNSREPSTVINNPPDWLQRLDFTNQMMYADAMTYLTDDVLAKVDRAAMGVSLESRVPFLDRRVVEFAWKLPLSMKVRDGQGKWLLRQVLYQYVPQALIDRPKMGFGVPIDLWLRHELRDWAEALLDEARLEREGFFNVRAVRQQWAEHLSGEFDRCYSLWHILMFQAWLENKLEVKSE